jgi:hypothetical protein
MEDTMAGTQAKPDPVVEYTGTSDVREITAAQWAKAGIEGQNLTRWHAENNFKLPVGELSKEALELLAKDSEFKFPDTSGA